MASLFVILAASAPAGAQAERPANVGGEVAAALREWVDDFARERLAPRGIVRRGGRLQPAYVQHAAAAGLFDAERDGERLTHLDMLQKLLFHAEHDPSELLADAVLGVAAVGLDGGFLDHDAYELRELGHWTLMRMDQQASWFLLLRAAAGERPLVFADMLPAKEADEAITVGPARRVAAIRLLGQRALPVFRSTLEAALADPEPRVRLAVAESLLPPWRLDTLQKVAAALQSERHPIVSQALVRLLHQILRNPPEGLDVAARTALVDGALQRLGQTGWRADLDLLELVEAWPSREAIPRLIALLDLEIRSPDALVAAVNQRASPRLRDRAGGLLKAMTGALVPIDDPAAWREFWQRERDHIVVPQTLKKPDPYATRAEFFGVQVSGGSIGFLIDTSGSMDEAAASAPETGPRRRRADTRLGAAKEQLVLATQAMDEQSQFFLLTFADEARAWTKTPIRPDRRSSRSLTELLARLHAHGGTNLYAGLMQALEVEGRAYGERVQPKIDELFVLSDGEPTTGPVRDEEHLAELVREANRYAQVRIHCVLLGGGSGERLLRRIAEENGGVFVQR